MSPNEKKVISYLKKNYKSKINLNSKLFDECNIDSFEFVKIISELETLLKKTFSPKINENFLGLSIKKFSSLFR